MKELLEEYAELKAVVKEAEAKMEALKPQIMDQLQEGTKYDIGNAVIELRKGRTVWRYSEDTVEMEQSLKERKKEEEQTGIAEATTGAPILFCEFKK